VGTEWQLDSAYVSVIRPILRLRRRMIAQGRQFVMKQKAHFGVVNVVHRHLVHNQATSWGTDRCS
jgi:hypothetical protein